MISITIAVLVAVATAWIGLNVGVMLGAWWATREHERKQHTQVIEIG